MNNYMEQMSATSTLALFETTKEERRTFVEDLLMRMDGSVNPIDIHLQIKCFEEIAAMLTDSKKYPETSKRYKDMLLDSVQKYGKSFEYKTAIIEQKETGTKYDYSKCGDIVMNDLLSRQKDLDALVKQREAFLKTVSPKGMTVVDEETGEATIIYPPSKKSTSSISVSLQ